MLQPANGIPEGMHSLTPHLICRGAASAIEYYKAAFGAVELVRIPGAGGRLMNASVRIGDSILMLFEENPEWGALGPKALKDSPVTIHLAVPNVDEVFARALAAGGKEIMAVTDMFWGDRYGKLEDPFGHSWAVATRTRDVPLDELSKAGPEAMRAPARLCSALL
jgi:PhnB protein